VKLAGTSGAHHLSQETPRAGSIDCSELSGVDSAVYSGPCQDRHRFRALTLHRTCTAGTGNALFPVIIRNLGASWERSQPADPAGHAAAQVAVAGARRKKRTLGHLRSATRPPESRNRDVDADICCTIHRPFRLDDPQSPTYGWFHSATAMTGNPKAQGATTSPR
jgi:hypothetical protein